MPIYEFLCRNCGKEFSKLTSFDWKNAGIACPECDSTDLDHVVSLVGISGGDKDAASDFDSSYPSCPTGTCNL